MRKKPCAAFDLGEIFTYDILTPIKHLKQPCKRCGKPYDEHDRTDFTVKSP